MAKPRRIVLDQTELERQNVALGAEVEQVHQRCLDALSLFEGSPPLSVPLTHEPDHQRVGATSLEAFAQRLEELARDARRIATRYRCAAELERLSVPETEGGRRGRAR